MYSGMPPPPWGYYPYSPPQTPIHIEPRQRKSSLKEWIKEQEAWEEFQKKREKKEEKKEEHKRKTFTVSEMFCILTIGSLLSPLWMKLLKVYLISAIQ